MTTDSQIVAAMVEYGGSFVKALAEAWRRADPVNRKLIKDTWPEYWERYKQMVTKPELAPDADHEASEGDRKVGQPAALGAPYGGKKKIIVQSGHQSYLVRRVDVGDRYGRHFCLTHPQDSRYKDEPMIEFYLRETKYPDYDFVGPREEAEAAGAEPLGWFVSRYYARTLLDRRPNSGLCLHGGSLYDPSYSIEAAALNEALKGLGFPTNTLETK